ncbi:MAG: insulinase family protein [Bacteroidales bacterium]|nr:insulinase family protein [Bacteroidales bacterium]MCF8454768.1 insulinase family protein [Bacteroidales bacterium]
MRKLRGEGHKLKTDTIENMINRQIPPSFNKIEKIEFLKPQKSRLSNGIPVFTFFAENNHVVRVDLVFDAGSWFQPNVLVASFTNALLREGSRSMSSSEIAEKLDFYGAYLSLHSEKDKAVVTLYCLHKHYKAVVQIVADLIKFPVFPEHELRIHANKRKEQFRIDSEKVKVLAHRKFQEVLFPGGHPYGQLATIDDFDQVQGSQISNFHKMAYNANNCKLYISGFVDDEVVELTNTNFGEADWSGDAKLANTIIDATSLQAKSFRVSRKDSVQSAIRVGKLLFNQKHPDFIDMRLLNTLLGGYFGSRLMANIREDKGYTYGIHSSMVSMQQAGFFAISTEVGSEFVEPTLIEILKEIEKLKTELVNKEELERVKSYFVGNMIRSFDGPFATMESFRSVIEYGLEADYFDQAVQHAIQLTSERILELAQKYLDFDSMKVVVAG